MKLNLKSGASSSKEIEIDESSNVKELRQKVAEAFDTEVAQVVLIFAGKIIKDDQSLSENKVSDGKAVHVVIKKGSASAAPTQSAPTRAPVNNAPATPTAAPTSNNTNPLAGGIPGMQGLGGMSGGNMQDMQNQMMQNPEMMSRLMDNPMVQSLMSDPAVINEMMNSNPQMRQVMEQNPEVGAVMRDPENLRRAMNMMRNPAAMQEMMRNQDQALRNVESMPGGSAALGRMFNDVLNPMQDAMGGQNPYQAAAASDSNNANNTGSSETAPNPWAANTNSTNAEANTTNTASNQGLPQMSQGLQDAMRNHMMQNPQLLTSMFGERMNVATDNPEVANRVSSLLTNPSLITSMQKPEVRAALTKIQEGFAVINREAPELARAMGMPDMGAFGGNMFTGGSSASANTPAATPSVPPEERFKDQLDQLAAMGFADRARSIQALQACGGNVQMAVNWLLEN